MNKNSNKTVRREEPGVHVLVESRFDCGSLVSNKSRLLNKIWQ